MEFLHRTWAEIDVDALVHNFGIIKKEAAGTKIMAVVRLTPTVTPRATSLPCLRRRGRTLLPFQI